MGKSVVDFFAKKKLNCGFVTHINHVVVLIIWFEYVLCLQAWDFFKKKFNFFLTSVGDSFMEMLIAHFPFWMTFENSTSFSPARIRLLSFLCYGCERYTCMPHSLVGVASCHLFLYFLSFSLYDVSEHNKSVAVVGAGVRFFFFFYSSFELWNNL